MLRGFAFPGRRRDRLCCWQYGATAEPVAVNIRDAARGRDFYSEPALAGAGPTLDDLITEYEGGQFAPKLASLRSSAPGSIISADTAAEIGSHLIVRAAHFRDVFRMFVAALIGSMKRLQGDPRFAKALLGYGQPEGDKAREMVRAELAKRKDLPPDLAERLENAMHTFLGELLEVRAIARARANTTSPADFEDKIIEAQRNSLRNSLVPEHYIKRLSQFMWTTHKAAQELLGPTRLHSRGVPRHRLQALHSMG